MLSLLVHFSVCLCSGKCYQSLSLVGTCVLLSMVVHTLTHSVSSQISTTPSVQLQKLENASSSITPDRKLTYTTKFQSLSELQALRRARVSSLHISAIESTPDISSITQIYASRRSRQAEPFLHSKLIMLSDITSEQYSSSIFPSKTVSSSDRASSSILQSKFEEKLEWSSSSVIQSIFDRKSILDRPFISEEKSDRQNLSLLPPSFSQGQSEQPRSYTLQWEPEQHNNSIFTSELHGKPEQSFSEKYQKLSPSLTEFPNLHVKTLSQSSPYRTSMPSTMVTENLDIPPHVENTNTTVKRFEVVGLEPSVTSTFVSKSTDVISYLLLSNRIIMDSDTLGKTDEEKHKLGTSPTSEFTQAHKARSDAPVLSSLSLENSAFSPLTEDSLFTITASSPLSGVSLSAVTATWPLSEEPISTKATTSAISENSLSTQTTFTPLSEVSFSTVATTWPLSEATLSAQIDASSLSSVSLSTETAASSLSSVSLSTETATSSISSVSLTTETAASSLSSVSLSTETAASSLSSVSLSTETATSSLSSALLSTEIDASSISDDSLSAIATSIALSEDSLSKVKDSSPLSGVSLLTKTATPTLSKESLSTQTAFSELSDVSLSTLKAYLPLSEDSSSVIAYLQLSDVSSSASSPLLEDSSGTKTTSMMLSEDSLVTTTATSPPSEGSFSTETNPPLSKESLSMLKISFSSISTSSPLLEDSILIVTATSSMPVDSPEINSKSTISDHSIFTITATSPLSGDSFPLTTSSPQSKNQNWHLSKDSLSTQTTVSSLSGVSLSTVSAVSPLSELKTASTMLSENLLLTSEGSFSTTTNSPISKVSLFSIIKTSWPSADSSSTVKPTSPISKFSLSAEKSSPLSGVSVSTKTSSSVLSEVSLSTETTTSAPSENLLSAKTATTALSDVSLSTLKAYSPLSQDLSPVTAYSTLSDLTLSTTYSPLSGDSLSVITAASTPSKELSISKQTSSMLSKDSLFPTTVALPLSENSFSTETTSEIITTKSTLVEKPLFIIRATSPPLEVSFSTISTSSPLSIDSLSISSTSQLLSKDSLFTTQLSQDSISTITTTLPLSKYPLSTRKTTLPLSKHPLSTFPTSSPLSKDSLLPIMTTLQLSKKSLSGLATTSPLIENSSVTITTSSVVSEVTLSIKTTTSPLLKDSSSTITTSSMLSDVILSTKTTTLPLSDISSLIAISPLSRYSLLTFTAASTEYSSFIMTPALLLEDAFSTIITTLPISKKSSSSTIAVSSMILEDSLSTVRADSLFANFSFSTASVLSEEISITTTNPLPLSKGSLSTVSLMLSEVQLSEDSSVSMFASPQLTEILTSTDLFITVTSTSLLSDDSLITVTASSSLPKVSFSTIITTLPLTEYSPIIIRASSLLLEDSISTITTTPPLTEYSPVMITASSLPPEDSLSTIKTSSPLSGYSLSTITTSSTLSEYSFFTITASSPLSEYSLSTITTALPLSVDSPSVITASLPITEDLLSPITVSMPLPVDLLSIITASLSLSEDSLSSLTASLLLSEDLLSATTASLGLSIESSTKDDVSPSFIQQLNTDIVMQSVSDKSEIHILQGSFTEQRIQSTPESMALHTDIQQSLASFSELKAHSIYTNRQMTQPLYIPSVYTESGTLQPSSSDTVSIVKEMENLSEKNVEEWQTDIPYMTSFIEIQRLLSANTATQTLNEILAPSIFSTYMILNQIGSSQETANYFRSIFLPYTEEKTSTQTDSLSPEYISKLSTFTNEHLQVTETVDGKQVNITNFSEYNVAKSRKISPFPSQVFPFEPSAIKEKVRVTESFTDKRPSTSSTKKTYIQNIASDKKRNELGSSNYFVTFNVILIPSASFSETSINVLESRPSQSTISVLTDVLPSSILLTAFLMKESESTSLTPKVMSPGTPNVSTSLSGFTGTMFKRSSDNVVPSLAELPKPSSSSIELTDFESKVKVLRPVKSLLSTIPSYPSTFSTDSVVLQSLKLLTHLTSFYERDHNLSPPYHGFMNMKETGSVSTPVTRDITSLQSALPLISFKVLETQPSSSTTMFKFSSSIEQESIFSAATVREGPKVLSTTFKQEEMTSATATEIMYSDVPSSSSLLSELIESAIAYMTTNLAIFSSDKQKRTTLAVITPMLISVQTQKTEGIYSTVTAPIPGAVQKQSLLFTSMYVSFEKESLPSAIKSESVFPVKEIASVVFFDVLMKESKSEPLSTVESLINDMHTLKMSSSFNEFQFSEQAISSVEPTLPLIEGLTKHLFITEDDSLSEGKGSSIMVDFPQVKSSFSEFIALQSGQETSASTPALTYIPNMSSSVIKYAYLQLKSRVSDASSSFLTDHIPLSEYRTTEAKMVYKPIGETGLTKQPKRPDSIFVLDPFNLSSAKLAFSPIITESNYLLEEKSSPCISETTLMDTPKFSSSFYKSTLLKSERLLSAVASTILDSTDRVSSFSKLESTHQERLSISADTSQMIEGTETRLAVKHKAVGKTQMMLSLYPDSILKEGPTLSSSSSEVAFLHQTVTSEATITSLLKVINKATKSFVKNELSLNQTASFKYLTPEKILSTFKQPTIETRADTRHLEISASSSVLGVEFTSSLKANMSIEPQMLFPSVQSKLNKIQLGSSPEIFSSYFSTLDEETTHSPSPYVDSSLSTERTKQSSVKTSYVTFPRGDKFALSTASLLPSKGITGSWNSGTNIKSSIDLETLSTLFGEMNSDAMIYKMPSSAMLSMSTKLHSEAFLTEKVQPFFPSDSRSDFFSSSVQTSSFIPETSILVSTPCTTTLEKQITVSTTLGKRRSISSSSEKSSYPYTFLSPSFTSEPFFSTEETLHYPGVFSQDVSSGRGRFHENNQGRQEVVTTIVPTPSTDILASSFSAAFQNKFQLSSEMVIYPSRNMITLLTTYAKMEYFSSSQRSRLFSGHIEEKLSSVSLAMASLLESTEVASSLATEGTDNTGGVSQASLATTSHIVNIKTATSLTPSPVVTSDVALEKTVAKTNLESKKIVTVSPLTIGILVKNAVNISSNEFETKIKEGLKRCYYEGIAKDIETNNRGKRDGPTVTVQVTDMHRNPVRPKHVNVKFYVLVDGKAQPTAQVLAIFSRLTIAETSAYLSFPVIANVKVEVNPDVEKATDQDGARASFMTYVLVGVTSVGAVIAMIILAVWYCQKEDHHLKRPRSSLEDAELKIDIEKGEVVSVSVDKDYNLHPYVFDNGKDNFNSVLQHFEWNFNLTKATGERKTGCSPKGSISEIHSASQRLKRLRKLGFRGCEIRKPREDFNETCSSTNRYTQRSGHIDDDLNAINDLGKTTNPRLDVIQKCLINDSSSKNKEVNLQYPNDQENNNVQMMKANKESSQWPFQLNMNINPNCHPSTSCSRKINDSLLFHSSGLNLESDVNESVKVIPFVRSSGHRKKLKQTKTCESVKSTTLKDQGLVNFMQGRMQSERLEIPGKQMEGFCCKVKAGPFYESLPLGNDSSVRKSMADNQGDEVFLADKIPFSDLSTKGSNGSERHNSDLVETFPSIAPRRERKQKQNFSSSGNFCDIIRTCDSNNDSYLANKLDVKLGISNKDMDQMNSEESMLDKDIKHSSDNPYHLKNCCNSFIDGSEYAGHEFESLNFTTEYTVSDRGQRCEQNLMENTAGRSSMTQMVDYRPNYGPNVCEHVTKMGRFGKRHRVNENIGPQFRKVQYQDQEYPTPLTRSSTPVRQSPRETPAFRSILPKIKAMKEIGIQTSELENGIRQKDSSKNYKKNLTYKENDLQQTMGSDHTVFQDQISEESNLTGKHFPASDTKQDFNDTPEKRSSHKNGQKLPSTKDKSLSDENTCDLDLPGISMNNEVDDTSNVAKENIVPEKEVNLNGYFGKKGTQEDKQAWKKRKTPQFRNSLNHAMNIGPRHEEIEFSKVDDVTGRKTTDNEELLIHKESEGDEYPQKIEPEETKDLPQEGGTVSTITDSVPYFEEVSKVEHTTGGRLGLERKFDQRSRPMSKDTLSKNEEKQSAKGLPGKQDNVTLRSLSHTIDDIGDIIEPRRASGGVSLERPPDVSPYVEMKLGRNMRAAPKGSIGPRIPQADINQQLLDATEPLLHSQPQPSNDLVDYFTSTQSAGFSPVAQGAANAPRQYPARSMTCPQHPSQHLIETLNRNSHTSLTHPTQREEFDKPEIEQQQQPRIEQEPRRREQQPERFNEDSEAQSRPKQDFVTEETLLKELVKPNEQNVFTVSADITSPPPPPVDALYGNSASFNKVGEISATTSSFKGTDTYSEFRAQNAGSLEKQETEEVEEIAEEIHNDDHDDESDDGKMKDEDFDF